MRHPAVHRGRWRISVRTGAILAVCHGTAHNPGDGGSPSSGRHAKPAAGPRPSPVRSRPQRWRTKP
jgi:hypothetical protein